MYDVVNFAATGRDLHFDTVLSNLSVAFRPKEFIVDRVAPIVPVKKQSNLYRIWSKEDALRIAETYRAPKTPVKRIQWGVSSKAYFAKNYALGTDIALEDLANADNDIDLRANAVEGIVDGLWRDWENRVATFMTNTTNVGSAKAFTGTAQWTNETQSDPINDFLTGRNSVFSTTGFEPNKAVMGRQAFQNLAKHPAILEKLFPHGSGGEFATESQVAKLLGLDEILVGRSIKNTADEDITGTFSEIWGNHCVMYYVPPRPSILTPSFMYSFRWTNPKFPAPFGVKHGVKNQVGDTMVEIFETMYYQTEEVIASELSYLMLDVV